MKYTESQLVQAFISHCCDRRVIKIYETVGEDSKGVFAIRPNKKLSVYYTFK